MFFSFGYDSYPLFDSEKSVTFISCLIIILITDFYLFKRFLSNFLFPYFSFFISDYFNFIDIPDYRDKETLWNKLTYAIDNATTFEIV